MKSSLRILLSVFILSVVIEIKPAPFDTGMATFTQPNDVSFTGRIWGDEFIWWAETENGYRFIQSGDGWYYYATLDQNGEYAPTNYKVGMDWPPASSYKLERTESRIEEITQQIEEFNEQIELNRQWFAQKQAEAHNAPVTLKIGIILIEFTDVKHFDPDEFPRLGGYLTADFDSMMFSYNYWIGSGLESPHPEDEAIFGSFRDYWDQMSLGKLKITGRVVNPTDENGIPVWIEADNTREYYANAPLFSILAYEAIQKAIELGYVSENPGSPNYYDKYAVVYAQDAILSGALSVHAESLNGKNHFLAERSGPNLYGGGPFNKSFTHIGIYAHEFGHTIGFPDEYAGQSVNSTDIFNFCLMAWEIYNGPDNKGACPATLSPLNRIEWDWLSSVPISQDISDFTVQYSYTNPIVYRIDPYEATGDEHYLIESKGREGFDLYIPGDPVDTVNQPGRLLIWHANVNRIEDNGSTFKDRMILKAADNISDKSTQLTDFFPSTFNPDFQDFNDITIPASTLGYNVIIPQLYIDNERPAHFTLNGIQKQANGNTLIEEIKLYHPLKIVNYNSGDWQTVSVPFGLTDYSISAVFPTKEPGSSVFKYNGVNYVQVDTLENGHGYFAKFPAGPQSLSFQGSLIEKIKIPLHQGWNITGSVSYSIPVSNINTIPPNIITGTIYQCDKVYAPVTDFIRPGVGYWIYTTDSGELEFDKNAAPNELREIKFDEMDKFIITDADGFYQTLFVANTDIDTVMAGMNIDLPPFFPELDFDSRFEYNEYVKKVSADSGEIDLNILVHTNSYPVNLTWELNPKNGINYSFINDTSLGKISVIESNSGTTAFSTLTNNRIQLQAFVNKANNLINLPSEYVLKQNYPNPFNPVTTIKYDIIGMQDVKVTIYDILGREVKTLVNEQQQPGSYTIKWDASNVSSGVYFYQLKTKDYTNTKKMILLR